MTRRTALRPASLPSGSPAARTYALVALHCRHGDFTCQRSLRELACALQLAPSTILCALRDLIRLGYLRDLGPAQPGRRSPHIYCLTGKPVPRR